ncbi:MAG: MalY/PatB family protein [Eubacteriales bacterium]
MAEFFFDRPVDRRNTDCLKYDFAVERGKPADVLPLWVADMDFPTAPTVIDALEKAVRFGIFGYSDTKSDYDEALAGWFSKRFDWQIQPNWLVKTPGVVYALAMAVRAFSEPGDAVLIQTPVYYPFYGVIKVNDRRIVENPLVLRDGRYYIDFEDFEQKIVSEGVRIFILCSPHNPVGRVWTPEELKKMGEICRAHNVMVVSDEIHCDITLPGHPHTMFLKANPDLADRCVCCTAPSKTFNLAGLQVSNILIPDGKLRHRFEKEIDRTGYSQLNMLGLVACKAAYQTGEAWLEECLAYLRGNLACLRDYLQQNLPQIHLIEPEGTYFAWLDFSELGLSDPEIDDLVTNKAKLWLDAGPIFGRESGKGFQRIALSCQRATLKKALNQLSDAVGSLRN